MRIQITVGTLIGYSIVLLLGVGLLNPVYAANPNESAKKNIYDPGLDVTAAITSALVKTQKENKHVLLMFGGNWCPWCRRLHKLIHSDAAIKKFLAENYILIMVDVGETNDEPLNRDLVDYYRVKNFGYPCLAVLDNTGRLLGSHSTGILEKGKGHDPERVLGLLKAMAPNK